MYGSYAIVRPMSCTAPFHAFCFDQHTRVWSMLLMALQASLIVCRHQWMGSWHPCRVQSQPLTLPLRSPRRHSLWQGMLGALLIIHLLMKTCMSLPSLPLSETGRRARRIDVGSDFQVGSLCVCVCVCVCARASFHPEELLSHQTVTSDKLSLWAWVCSLDNSIFVWAAASPLGFVTSSRGSLHALLYICRCSPSASGMAKRCHSSPYHIPPRLFRRLGMCLLSQGGLFPFTMEIASFFAIVISKHRTCMVSPFSIPMSSRMALKCLLPLALHIISTGSILGQSLLIACSHVTKTKCLCVIIFSFAIIFFWFLFFWGIFASSWTLHLSLLWHIDHITLFLSVSCLFPFFLLSRLLTPNSCFSCPVLLLFSLEVSCRLPLPSHSPAPVAFPFSHPRPPLQLLSAQGGPKPALCLALQCHPTFLNGR